MLAPVKIPRSFLDWNRQQGAPSGYTREKRVFLKPYVSENQWLRWSGPFSIQGNSSTRRFEYPWAYFAGKLDSGMNVLEIGGGLSGFQFVLDRIGCSVTNVDPGMDQHDWPCTPAHMNRLNKLFGTSVHLLHLPIEEVTLEENAYDRIFSISVLEHFPRQALDVALQKVKDALKPGGLFILTVDLYLNLIPFTMRPENEYGTNQNMRQLVEESGLILETGVPAELYGYSEFDSHRIQTRLEEYLIGGYPTLTQCLVLRKP